MALDAGTKLGAFEIAGLLGKGGMGEVYRAGDTKLGRDVAIKVLGDVVAGDPEYLKRFEKEAKVLASLSHANIGAIFDFQHHDGAHFLVMELVEGDTLSDRIKRGPLSLREALPIFVQIARGLDAAHEAGLVHRDLKPANIKISPKGEVKVLDFGIAKDTTKTEIDHDAPTTPMTASPVTGEGLIIGTPQYMSPEQARGKEVDRRTDVWAFGCCLYESLTGKMPFTGDTISDVVSEIIQKDPDWSRLPELPPRAYSVLHRAFEKDVHRRLSSMNDISIMLEEAKDAQRREQAVATPGTSGVSPLSALGLALVTFAIGAVTMFALRPPMEEAAPADTRQLETSALLGDPEIRASAEALLDSGNRQVRRFHLLLDPKYPISPGQFGEPYAPYAHVSISPDDRYVMYRSGTTMRAQLLIRAIDELGWRPISHTQGAGYQYGFSHDGRSIYFHSDGAYLVMTLDGGTPQFLTAHSGTVGNVVWLDEHSVVAGPSDLNAGLTRFDLRSGEHEILTTLDTERGEAGHYPISVERENGLIFFGGYVPAFNSPEDMTFVYSLEDGSINLISEHSYDPLYVENGFVLTFWDSKTTAQRFDTESRKPFGPRFDVTEVGSVGKDLSQRGTLVYPVVKPVTPGRGLVWVNMDGTETRLPVPGKSYGSFDISSDPVNPVIVMSETREQDLWLYEIGQEFPFRRLTFDASGGGGLTKAYPFWIGDSGLVGYTSTKVDSNGLFSTLRIVNTSGPSEGLATTPGNQEFPLLYGMGATPDGTRIIGGRATSVGVSGLRDLWYFPIGDGDPAEKLLAGETDDFGASLSPDGRWVAYMSNEVGDGLEVLVSDYPGLKRKWQVSPDGLDFGTRIIWAPDGNALYYRSKERIMRVPVRASDDFRAGDPEKILDDVYYHPPQVQPGFTWDIHPDGTRFLFLTERSNRDEAASELVVIQNWTEVLEEKARAAGALD